MKKQKLDKKAFKIWYDEAIKIAKQSYHINIKTEKKAFIEYYNSGFNIQQSIENFINK